MDTIELKNTQFLLPCRIALIGDMNSGKSFWVKHFIEHFQKITNSDETGLKKKVLFCYNSPSSIK